MTERTRRTDNGLVHHCPLVLLSSPTDMAKAFEPIKGVDWQAVRAAAEADNKLGWKALGERFNVSAEAIRKRAVREKWGGVDRAIAAAARALIPHPERLKEGQGRVLDAAVKATSAAVSDLVSAAVRQSRVIMDRAHEHVLSAPDARSLRDAAAAWSIGHAGARTAMGLDQGPVMPDGWNPGGGSSPLIVVMQPAPEIGHSAPAGPVIDVTSPPDSQIT